MSKQHMAYSYRHMTNFIQYLPYLIFLHTMTSVYMYQHTIPGTCINIYMHFQQLQSIFAK